MQCIDGGEGRPGMSLLERLRAALRTSLRKKGTRTPYRENSSTWQP